MDYLTKNISVIDDLISGPLRRSIGDVVNKPIWQYGWRSNSRRDKFCFWHASFAGGGIESRENCEPALARNAMAAPIYELWKILEAGPLRGHEPLRVYANSHTYGVEGYVHTDNDDSENYFSTIYYAHPVWHKNWSGETVFFTHDGQDIIKSVYPRPGRIVSFPGAIPHAAHAPSRECTELRVSIVIKTQRRDNERS